MNDTVPFAIFAYNQFNIKRMNEDFDYLEINRKSWNNRVDVHLKSDFYDVEGFLKGESSLNDIELGFGDIKEIYSAFTMPFRTRYYFVG